MKAPLLHRDEMAEVGAGVPAHAGQLADDLGLDAVVAAMAAGDRFVGEVARPVLLAGLSDPAGIRYRQDVLRDAMHHPGLVRELYRQATRAVTSDERRTYMGFGASAATTLSGAVHVMAFLLDVLQDVRALAADTPGDVRSDGLTGLLATLTAQIDDRFLAQARSHLQALRLPAGIDVQARLGRGLSIADPVLLPPARRRPWARLLPTGLRSDTIEPSEDDEDRSGLVDALRDRSLSGVAATLARSTEHVTGFFERLRTDLAFYVGSLNLADALTAHGQPVCIPELADTAPAFRATGLYDAGLSLRQAGRVVGNDVDADGRPLVLVTGANQGGKSTFLRSVGIAQLMARAGMFVPATSLRLDVRRHVYTHFRTGEDPGLRRGQLDDELARMRAIVDRLEPGDTVLLNESFSSTNDREGSEIAAGIVRALVEAGVTVFFVTHLLDVGDALEQAGTADTVFLRAERLRDGRRTFRMVEGAPQSTSFAEDVFRQVFGTSAQ